MKRSSLIHLSLFFLFSYILQYVWDYSLETAITLLIFYEVGGRVPFLDELITINEKLVKWLKNTVDAPKIKRKKKKDA